jgi:hypothetical protein
MRLERETSNIITLLVAASFVRKFRALLCVAIVGPCSAKFRLGFGLLGL